LLCAFADEKTIVGVEDIKAAVAELDWKEHESNTGRYDQLQKLSKPVASDAHVTQIEVIVEGESLSVQSFPEGRVIIGRSPDNEIYIKSKFVSRHHAQLISDDQGCLIEDLNSTNGVFIGDRQVKKHRLHSGDAISLGIHQLVYTDLRALPAVDQMDSASESVADDEASALGE
jgi:pSer/pThr/pTyr-binding forkhead associated (FHA) protein